MPEPVFRDWLLAVTPRFPRLGLLAAVVRDDADWPEGYDKPTLRSHLRRSRHRELAPALAEALEAFELLCTPTVPIPDEQTLPWDWHSPRMVENSKASMKRHSRNRGMSTQEYRWQLGRRLASEMAGKTRVYIDTCHWLKMRDFELGRSGSAAYGTILTRLRQLVASGRFICPLSPALLMELQTQTDLTTRLHTARLMQELSHSIGLPHIDEMEKLELKRRAFDTCFGSGRDLTDWQVWTKAVFLLGEIWPAPPPWMESEEETWWLQKCFLDSVWEAPFEQIVSTMPEALSTKQLRVDFAKELNADMQSRPAQDFESERQRANAMVIRRILLPTALQVARELKQVADSIPGFQMPRLDPNAGPDPWCIPSVQILAGIEALIRTTGRKFRENDMFDLFHCAAAIPYCQVFFCDGAFKHMVNDPKLRYPEKYGVTVLSTPDEIEQFL